MFQKNIFIIIFHFLIIISLSFSAEDTIINNPLTEYEKFRERLDQYGQNAPFPEFEGVIDQLLQDLNTPQIRALIKHNVALKFHHDIVSKYLFHIRLKFVIDGINYPYQKPYSGPYPYRPTLEAIRSSLEFFDIIERCDSKNRAEPLYHTDRYFYHWGALLDDPKAILFPTTRELCFNDLIKVRCVPIGFLGVTTKTIFADRHYQSPLDFMVHDVNHFRRMLGYNRLRLKELEAQNLQEELGLYKKFDCFLKNIILPHIDYTNHAQSKKMIPSLMRMIIFEILHESAYTPDKESIVKALTHIPGDEAPFEHMLFPNSQFKHENLEQYRTKTGNLESGAELLGRLNPKTTTVRYFMDKGPSLLNNVYNKSVHGFYDRFDKPDPNIAPIRFRNHSNLVAAACFIFDLLGVKSLDRTTMLSHAKSPLGIERKYTYPRIELSSVNDKNRKNISNFLKFLRK